MGQKRNRITISVIIPVYNVEAYIEDCIRSVMRQTYTGPLECILVDDCGSDNSMKIAQKIISEYIGPISFNILHHTHNRGLSAARNTGMDVAKGDYYFFLDSDDELTNNCIEILAKPLNTEYLEVIEGKAIGLIEAFPSSPTHPEMEVLRQPHILQTYKKEWNVTAWNRLYSALFIRNNKLRFKEGLLHEDLLWSFQIACLAESLCIVNHNTYKYKQRLNSITLSEEGFVRKNNLTVILNDMSMFAKHYQVNKVETFRIISYYFHEILTYYSLSPLSYAEEYKRLRPLFTASFTSIIRKNHKSLKGFLADFHYMMPICIAPYWQYYLYYRALPAIKSSAIIRPLHHICMILSGKSAKLRKEQRATFDNMKRQMSEHILHDCAKGVVDKKYTDHDIIVSLTSHGKRLSYVAYTIESIMLQSTKANRIILWLDERLTEQQLPEELIKLQSRGLEIAYYKDIGPYAKLIPTLRQYPDDAIITIDDDIIYGPDILEQLINAYLSEPRFIHSLRIHKMLFAEDGSLRPYWKWDLGCPFNEPSHLNFATGVGGVLYTPHSLDKEVLNEKAFSKLCRTADDVWFKAMAIKKGTRVNKVLLNKPSPSLFISNPYVQADALSHINKRMNDKQIKNVFSEYHLYPYY